MGLVRSSESISLDLLSHTDWNHDMIGFRLSGRGRRRANKFSTVAATEEQARKCNRIMYFWKHAIL
jgi:hypothetical protein